MTSVTTRNLLLPALCRWYFHRSRLNVGVNSAQYSFESPEKHENATVTTIPVKKSLFFKEKARCLPATALLCQIFSDLIFLLPNTYMTRPFDIYVIALRAAIDRSSGMIFINLMFFQLNPEPIFKGLW